MATPRKRPEDKLPGGRKKFVPTEKQKGEVIALSAANFKHEAIAEFLGIHKDTLEKYFPDELRTTRMRMIANATSKLYAAVNKGEAWAVCFTLKTQGKDQGWSERVEHTGKNGAPIEIEKLNDAELDAHIGRIERYLSSRRAPG